MKIEVENFFSFRDKAVLKTNRAGLLLLEGQNKDSTTLSSNGCGKSTISVHALSWCLFGQTLSGIKHDAVAFRFNDAPCRVAVVTDRYKIVRQRRPHFLSVEIEGKKYTNETAEALIPEIVGFGFQTFRAGAVFAKGNFARFSSASHEEQLRVVDEILGINFDSESKKCKAYLKVVSDKLSELDWALDKNSFQTKSVEEKIASLEEEKRKHAISIKTQKKSFLDASKKHDLDIARYETQLETLEKCLTILKQQPTTLYKIWEKTQSALGEFRQKSRIQSQQSKSQMQELRDRISKLKDTKPSGSKLMQCESCLQSVSVFHLILELERKCEEIDKKRLISEKATDSEESKLVSKVSKAKKQYSKSLSFLREHYKEIDEKMSIGEIDLFFRSELVNVKLQAVNAKKAKAASQSSLADLEWKNSSLLEDRKLALLDLKKEQDSLKSEREFMERKKKATTFWADAFGPRGLRAMLFESESQYLNSRFSHHLSALAGDDANGEIRLDVVRGKMRIVMNVEWRKGGNSVIASSDGQKCRIDLAAFFALQDFAERRTVRGFPFRVFDEPSEALDARGRELLAEHISSEASKRDCTIVISHNKDFSAMLEPKTHVIVEFDNEDFSRLKYL